MRRVSRNPAYGRATYVESGLVALLVFAALLSIPGFHDYLAHIVTSFVGNLYAA